MLAGYITRQGYRELHCFSVVCIKIDQVLIMLVYLDDVCQYIF